MARFVRNIKFRTSRNKVVEGLGRSSRTERSTPSTLRRIGTTTHGGRRSRTWIQ